MANASVCSRVRRTGLGFVMLTFFGCGQNEAKTVEQVVCEPLAKNTSVLPLKMSNDPSVDGKLRAFVEAVRTMNDDLAQAESITAMACSRIAGDLSGAPPPAGLSAALACSQALQQIEQVANGGPIPIAIGTPTCVSDPVALGRCQQLCSNGKTDPGCDQLCQAEAASRGLCRAARIAVPDFTVRGPEWIKLGQVLTRHLPWLIHAHVALAKRLSTHAQLLAQVGAELPKHLEKIEPLGLACFGLGAANMAQTIARFGELERASAALLERVGVKDVAPPPAAAQPTPPLNPPPPPTVGPLAPEPPAAVAPAPAPTPPPAPAPAPASVPSMPTQTNAPQGGTP